jgi:hypothetical protein
VVNEEPGSALRCRVLRLRPRRHRVFMMRRAFE